MILPMQVLNERENWAMATQTALESGARAVVRLSARLPAALRAAGRANSLVGNAAKHYQAECRRLDYSLKSLDHGWGVLGPWMLWKSDDDPYLLKQLALIIEEGSSQGLLLDLDVYNQAGSVSRTLLGLPPRSCVVCGQPAAICVGRSIHSPAIVQASFLALLDANASTFLNPMPAPSTKQFHFIPPDLRTETPLA